MSKILSKKMVTLLLILAVIVLVVIVRWAASLNVPSVDPILARAKGEKGAKIEIIEFMDFQCPACAYGAQTLGDYISKHPKDIYLQMRYFPLVRAHRHAMTAAVYAECSARQGKFWPVHDALVINQNQWKDLFGVSATWEPWVKSAGVNMNAFNTCIESQSAKDAVNADFALGQSLGVQSTPTYFINQKMVVGVKSLVEELDNLLKQ